MKVSVVTGTLLWCWAHGTPRKKGQCLVNRLVPFQFAMQIFGRTRAGNLAISLSDILERSSNWLIYPMCIFFSVSEQDQEPKREAMEKSQQFTRYKFGSEARDSVAYKHVPQTEAARQASKCKFPKNTHTQNSEPERKLETGGTRNGQFSLLERGGDPAAWHQWQSLSHPSRLPTDPSAHLPPGPSLVKPPLLCFRPLSLSFSP
jgi:hypothetical protein